MAKPPEPHEDPVPIQGPVRTAGITHAPAIEGGQQ